MAAMAGSTGDDEKTTVYETEVQEGEPLAIKMPVDIRSVALTTLAVLAVILVLQYAQAVPHSGGAGGPDQLRARPRGDVDGRVITCPGRSGRCWSSLALCGSLGFGVYTLTDEAVDIIDDMPVAAQKLRDRMNAPRRQARGSRTAVEGPVGRQRDRQDRGRRHRADPHGRAAFSASRSCSRRSARPTTSGAADAACSASSRRSRWSFSSSTFSWSPTICSSGRSSRSPGRR